jgi:DNA-damage-inducible protein J
MANLNMRIDDTLKKQAERVLAELGMNFSTATTIFLKQVVRHNGIPFDLHADPFYSVENHAHLLAAKKRMEETGGTIHELIGTDDD